jgi:hypothetical protein
MSMIAKILLATFLGAVVCALLGFFMFFLLAKFDGTKTSEAFGYSLLIGIGCAFIGGLIGLVIGLADLKEIGGGLVGVLATVCIVAFYVFATARPGQHAYFFGESRLIFLVLSLPTILTGIITAMLKNLFAKP